MQKDSPLVPGKGECALQLLDIRDNAEAAERVGVVEGIRRWRGRQDGTRDTTDRQLQQRLGGFTRQVSCESKKSIFVSRLDVGDPFSGNPVGEELFVGSVRE